jgi:hypothetical protein
MSNSWDCFYVAKGGVVTIKGDGGYANVRYSLSWL